MKNITMATNEQSIMVYGSRRTAYANTLLGLFAPAFSFTLLFLSHGYRLGIIVCLCLTLSSISFLHTGWQVFRVPVLIMSPEGIYRPHTTSKLFCRWDEIMSIYTEYGREYAAFCLDLSLEGLTTFYQRHGTTPFPSPRPQQRLALSEKYLAIPAEQLLDQVHAHFAKQLQQYHIEIPNEL